MAFQDITFPELRLLHGISKSRGDNTVVFGNGYREYRIRRNKIDPLVWTLPARDLYVDDARELIDFYNDVDGGMDSFKFVDPDDHQWTKYRLSHYKDDKWKVTSMSGSPIRLASVDQVYLNDTPQGPALVQTDDDHPYIIVTGSSSGSRVEVNGSFYYVARFDSPLVYNYNAFDRNNNTLAVGIESFTLKEVNEHA